jgi:hypothetical protein
MGIQRLNYLSVDPKLRRESAKQTLSQLQQSLLLPGISEEQKAQLQSQSQTVQKWANGTLPIPEEP